MTSYLRFKALLGLAALAAILSTGLIAQTFNATGLPIAVPDSPSAGVGMNIPVSGLAANVTNVTVTMTWNPQHTWGGDIACTLRAPGGAPTQSVFNNINNDDDDNLAGPYTFDSVSTNNIWTVSAATTGAPIPANTYHASNNTGAFVSLTTTFAGLTPAQANGTWVVFFQDLAAGDTGTVSALSITITTGAGAVPTVTGLAPTSGTTFGGTAVTITGTNFIAGATVSFGGTAATGITVVSATSITCTAPAHAAGVADVLVTTTGGTSANTAADNYTYVVPVPTVTGLAPTTGTTFGGTAVTITGTGFIAGATVSFGGTAATGITVVSATSITCTAPAHAAGVADVLVTTTGGTSANTAADNYTYVVPVPTVTGLAPTTGFTTGGTSVTITGTGFIAGATVTFGGVAATGVTVVSATSITCTSPANPAGVADVLVTTAGGTSANTAADNFTYTLPPAPTLTLVTPASGPLAGGQNVTLTGTDFLGASSVTFAGTAATAVVVVSATSITCTTPAGTAGTASVIVTTPGGSNAANTLYTYAGAPVVGGVAPVSGPIAGGTSVVITGTDFNGATSVLFGATAAAAFTVDSNTQITATSPAHALGLVDITVTTPSGTSAVVAADNFTFVAPEMDVTNGATAVADAGANDPLGNVPFGIAQTVTYTITNSGTGGLNLTGGTVVVVTAGTNVTTATVTTAPASTSIAPAGTVTFTITYTVTAAGAFDFAVSIDNDDADENPYTWTADGTGVLAPEMNVTRSGAIADGGTDAQAGAVAGTNIVLTYTISNSGNSVLTMTLPVTISGLVNCTCTVTTAPATATVAAAANETFVVTLKPTAAGSFSASVSITNDDPNENPYNWTISGTATAAPKKKKKDEGGCSTGDTNNALLMIAGVMATLGLALRLRRKTA